MANFGDPNRYDDPNELNIRYEDVYMEPFGDQDLDNIQFEPIEDRQRKRKQDRARQRLHRRARVGEREPRGEIDWGRREIDQDFNDDEYVQASDYYDNIWPYGGGAPDWQDL